MPPSERPVSRRAVLASVGAGLGVGAATEPSAAQETTTESWTLRLGGEGRYAFRDVAPVEDGHVLAGVAPAGETTAAWAVRLVEDRPVWLETYGGDRPSRATCVAATGDGGAVVGGATVAAGTDTERGWVVAVDADGAVRWERSFSGTRGVARSVAVAPNGDVLVVGRAQSGLTGVEGWLVRVTADGDPVYRRTVGRDLQVALNAVVVRDGTPLVAGLASRRGNRGDGLLATVTPSGALADRRRYDLDGLATGVTALVPTDDGTLVAGTHEGPRDHFDLWVASVDAAGDRRWTATFDRSRRDRLADAAATPDGGAVLVGRSDERDGSARDLWAVRVGPDGQKRWGRVLGGPGDDRGDGVAVSAGAYVVAGTRTTRADGQQGWVVRRSLDDAPPSLLPEPLSGVGSVGALAGVAGALGMLGLRARRAGRGSGDGAQSRRSCESRWSRRSRARTSVASASVRQ